MRFILDLVGTMPACSFLFWQTMARGQIASTVFPLHMHAHHDVAKFCDQPVTSCHAIRTSWKVLSESFMGWELQLNSRWDTTKPGLWTQ